jgi:hypothetical protein
LRRRGAAAGASTTATRASRLLGASFLLSMIGLRLRRRGAAAQA